MLSEKERLEMEQLQKDPLVQLATPIQQPTSNPAPLATETETQGGRTDAGSYNGTNDFLEMFKENYGYDYDGSPLTRREGMSDSVWNVLKNLYGYYQQGLNDESQKAADEENRNSYYDSQKRLR